MDRLAEKVLARAIRQIDEMGADELLAWVNRPLFASQKRPGSYYQRALAYAYERLDELTR